MPKAVRGKLVSGPRAPWKTFLSQCPEHQVCLQALVDENLTGPSP
jgi:hypothetical protein